MAEIGIYDVIILDRMLPNKEGVEILKYLRLAKIKTPVIFITARDVVANRIEGWTPEQMTILLGFFLRKDMDWGFLLQSGSFMSMMVQYMLRTF